MPPAPSLNSQRRVTIKYRSSKTCLCNLPLSVYGPLVQQQVRPQSLIVKLLLVSSAPGSPPLPHDASRVAHIGWSGLSSAPSLAAFAETSGGGASTSSSRDTIEVDPELCTSLRWPEGSQVELQLLTRPVRAVSVSVSPCSADDWELVSSGGNAGYLEDHLLGQLRAVKPGGVYPVWVAGGNRIWLRCERTDPSLDGDEKEAKGGDGEPVLVAATTEIFVAPMPRQSKTATATKRTTDTKGLGATKSSSSTNANGSTSNKSIRQQPQPLSSLEQAMQRLKTGGTGSAAANGSDHGGKEVMSSYSSDPTSASTRSDGNKHGPIKASTQPSSHRHLRSIPLRVFRQWPELVTALNERMDEGSSGSISTGWVGRRTMAELEHEQATGARGAGSKIAQRRKLEERKLTCELEMPEDLMAPLEEADDEQLPEAGRDRLQIELRILPGVPDGQVFLWPAIGPDDFVKGSLRDGAEERLGNDWMSFGVLPSSSKGSESAAPRKRSSSPEKLLVDSNHETGSSPLVGVDDHLSSAFEFFLAKRLMPSPSSFVREKPLLVTGPQGIGKTALAMEIARRLERDRRTTLRTIYVNCGEQPATSLQGIKDRFKSWVKDASHDGPSLLVLDGIDSFLRTEQENSDNTAVRAVAEYMSTSLLELGSRNIYMIATAPALTEIHPLLQTKHVFGRTISLRPLDTHKRRQILTELHSQRQSRLPKPDTASSWSADLDFVQVANQTEGYSPADLQDLVDLACQKTILRLLSSDGSRSEIELNDYLAAATEFKPRSLQNVNLAKSGVEWQDIGGLLETKRLLRETLEWPTKYSAIFAKCPLRLRSGLLLYGYPGCGKTLLASAVAKECGLHFISVKGPELLNKYIGQSEKSVRDIFDRATAAKPCVLFFDEFDSIAPKRGHDSTGVTDRVVNQLLTAMDGAEGLDGVYVLAATSRPDLIDPALLRPGRLDKSLICDLPDEMERMDILQAVSRKLDLDSTVNLAEYARLTQNFTGADLQALIYNAQLEAIHDAIEPIAGQATKTAQVERGLTDVDVWLPETAVKDSVASKAARASLLEQARSIGEASRMAMRGDAEKPDIALPKPKPIIQPHHLEKSLLSTKSSLAPQESVRLANIDREGKLPNGEAAQGVGQRVSLG